MGLARLHDRQVLLGVAGKLKIRDEMGSWIKIKKDPHFGLY